MNYEPRSYKNFLLFFLALFIFWPILIISFNFNVDPNARYHFSIPDPLLSELAQHPDKVLTLPSNYDDRALIKKFIRQTPEPEILILGGSRVLNVQQDFFTRARMLNLGVTTGTIRDYVALWQMVKNQKMHPKIVLIGLEEQSLSTLSQNERYLSVHEFYEAFTQGGMSLRAHFMGFMVNVKDLLSWQTTFASLKALSKPQKKNGEIVERASYDQSLPARTSSFSLLYPIQTENPPQAEVDNLGKANGQGEVKVFEMWNTEETRWFNLLTALIKDLKNHQAIPILIGMPYHPEAYATIKSSPKAFKNLLNFVKALKIIAVRESLFFYDGIEENHNLFEPEDFLDGVHLKSGLNNQLFSRALLSSEATKKLDKS